MKNKLWAGIALVFGVLFIGCPNPEGTELDTWTRTTSFTEIIGRWEGSATIPIPPIPISETVQLPASSVSYTLTMTITSDNFTEIIDINMDKYLTDAAGSVGKPAAWQIVQGFLGNPETEEGMDTNIEFTEDYHMILTVAGDISQTDFTGENSEYAPYINQNKTKIKTVFPEEIKAFLGEGEFILYKK
jgi:hypothetical protein